MIVPFFDRLITFAAVLVALLSFARLVSERKGTQQVCAACAGDARATEQSAGNTPPPATPFRASTSRCRPLRPSGTAGAPACTDHRRLLTDAGILPPSFDMHQCYSEEFAGVPATAQDYLNGLPSRCAQSPCARPFMHICRSDGLQVSHTTADGHAPSHRARCTIPH